MDNKIIKNIYYAAFGLIVLITLVMIYSVLPISNNFKILTVLSGSMNPKISTGSIVIVVPANDYKINDVITFKNSKSETPITHRIIEMQVNSGVLYYITKGDANNGPDRELVMKSDVIGKMLFSIPFIGYVIEFIRKPLGLLLVVLIPCVAIICEEIYKIWKEFKKNERNEIAK